MVLIVERGIAPKERLQQQDLYAERMSTGVKALTLKQSMSVSRNFLIFSKGTNLILKVFMIYSLTNYKKSKILLK